MMLLWNWWKNKNKFPLTPPNNQKSVKRWWQLAMKWLNLRLKRPRWAHMKQLPRQQRQQQRQQQKVQLRPLKRRPKLLLISQKPTTNFKLEKKKSLWKNKY